MPPKIRPAAHLLVLPMVLMQQEGKLYLELQAANGVRQWLADFDSMIVTATALADMGHGSGVYGVAWVPADGFGPAVQFVPLPMAYYEVKDFLRDYRRTGALLAECIDRAKYLQFGIGGLVGDWAG